MADNLESYFKKHLSDDTPAKDNWNVPSDDVWDKALPVIHKKKGLFIPWKYLYLIGGLLFSALLVVFLWPASNEEIDQTDQTSESIIENSTFVSEKENESKQKASSIIATSENKTSLILNEDNSSNNVSRNNKTQKLTEKDEDILKLQMGSNRSLDTRNQTGKTGIMLNTEQSGKPVDASDNSKLIIEKPKDQSAYYSSTNRDIEDLQGKTLNYISSEASMKMLTNNRSIKHPAIDKEAEKLDAYNNKGKFGIGAFFLPTFTTTYLTGDLNAGELETSNMYLYSNNWGLELKYFLSNRFTLVSGIGQSEVRSWSKSQVDFDYDSSNEHIMDTGEKENTSDVPMPTPFGKIDTEITYRFPGEDDIPDGEVMQSELETHQEVRYLTIPLGVEFNIIRFSRFSWFAETGIRYNRALKDAASFTSRILHEGHDMDVVGEEMTVHPTYKENYFDLYLGAGISYQFSKHFQINTSARYFNSITNVNFQDNMATHVRGFNIKISLVYIF